MIGVRRCRRNNIVNLAEEMILVKGFSLFGNYCFAHQMDGIRRRWD